MTKQYYRLAWKAERGYPTTMPDDECAWYEEMRYERKEYIRKFTKYYALKVFPEMAPKKNTFAYTDKEEVREKVEVLQLLESEGIPYKMMSGKAQFLCPFHQDKTASASFNIERKYFICFACGEKGDIFTFYSKLNGTGFAQTVEELNTL